MPLLACDVAGSKGNTSPAVTRGRVHKPLALQQLLSHAPSMQSIRDIDSRGRSAPPFVFDSNPYNPPGPNQGLLAMGGGGEGAEWEGRHPLLARRHRT